tara:strand:+ start:2508 stop:2720 length:213 start_codon:yes stop_codon:yes gene_type:complete
MIEADIKITVIGRIKSFGFWYPKYEINELNNGLLKTPSGAINTPRNGITAAMLTISAIEEIIINITKKKS